MSYIVQFIHLDDFVADLDDGDVSGIYYELVEQRIGVNDHGQSRWQMATIIRAIVSPSSFRTDGTTAHIASLTIPHGAPVIRFAGGNFHPGLDVDDDAARWRTGRTRHEAILERLHNALTPLDRSLARNGVVDVPAALSVIYAADPLGDGPEQTVDAGGDCGEEGE